MRMSCRCDTLILLGLADRVARHLQLGSKGNENACQNTLGAGIDPAIMFR